MSDNNTAGWIIVDRKTRALDWDGELHPTKEAARLSLTEDFSRNDEGWRPFELYEILRVLTEEPSDR
jgi:hypothetical protein